MRARVKEAGCYQKTTVMDKAKDTFTVTDRVGLGLALGLGSVYEFHLYYKTRSIQRSLLVPKYHSIQQVHSTVYPLLIFRVLPIPFSLLAVGHEVFWQSCKRRSQNQLPRLKVWKVNLRCRYLLSCVRTQ